LIIDIISLIVLNGNINDFTFITDCQITKRGWYMFKSKTYKEGRFRPRRGLKNNWRVWCCTGALHVLNTDDFATWLRKNPGKHYTIKFAGRSIARIQPDHPLWQKLKEISENYQITVSPLSWSRSYTEQLDSVNIRTFKIIRIRLK